jgi:hypothetical protein
MRHLDIAAVTVGDAAAAADISPEKLSTWLDKRVVKLSDRDKAADGSGDRRLMSLRTCHAVALTTTISALGVRHPVSGAIARRAIADPALYSHSAFVVSRYREEAAVVPEMPAPASGAIIIDATAVIRGFNERLASRVPELRAAGIV